MVRTLRLHPRIAAVGVLVLVAVLLRAPTLAQQSFWIDEFFTLEITGSGFFDVFDGVEKFEATPPGYYLLTSAWRALFGDSEVAVRSLSALCGIATVPILYLAGRVSGGERAGLIAGLLGAVSPLLVWYSQEARAYALLALISAVGFLFFVLALNERRERWIWGWAVASALAFTTHYFAFTIVVPEAVWLLVAMRGCRGKVAAATGAVVLVIAALVPLALDQRGRTSWVEAMDLGERLLQLPQHFLIGLQTPSAVVPMLAVAGLIAVLVALIARAGRPTRVAAARAAGILGAGLFVALLAAAVGEDFLLSRNLITLWPPFAVAVAVILGAPSSGRLGAVAAAAMAVLGAGFTLWLFLTPAAQRPDWSSLAEAVGAPSSSRVVVAENLGTDALPLVLYLDDSEPAPSGREVEAEELVALELRPVADHAIGPCWWGVLCGGRFPEVFAELIPPGRLALPAGLSLVESGATERLVYRRFRGDPAVRLPAADFSDLYLLQGPEAVD